MHACTRVACMHACVQIMSLIQARVGLQRIQKFMDAAEMEPPHNDAYSKWVWGGRDRAHQACTAMQPSPAPCGTCCWQSLFMMCV